MDVSLTVRFVAGSRRVIRRGTRLAAAGLVLMSVALTVPAAHASAGTAAQSCPRIDAPRLVKATPDAGLDARFTTYGDHSTRSDWSGADATYSVRLPDGRELWVFADTILGPVNADGSRPAGVRWIHNSFVVQSAETMFTVYTRSDPPAAVLTPAGPDTDQQWYWPAAATIADGALNVIYHSMRRTGPGTFGFALQRNLLARFSLRDLHLLGTHDLPSAVPDLEFGSWILHAGSYTYIYGVEDLRTHKYMHIARVRGTDLRGRWEFFTSTGWSRRETDSRPVLEGVGNEYSVTRLGTRYLLVTQDTTVPFGRRIVVYFACSPTGPFTDRLIAYLTPETGPTAPHRSRNIYTYNAHAHPELSRDGHIVISYNVNSLDPADLMRDASIYRPRFVDLTFESERDRWRVTPH